MSAQKNALAKRTGGGSLAARPDPETWYYERVERMKKFRQDPNLALSHDIVPKEGGGYALVTLSEAQRVMSGDDGDHGKSAGQSRGYSSAIGFDRSARRGRYNDESRLTLTEAISVETGEIQAFASM